MLNMNNRIKEVVAYSKLSERAFAKKCRMWQPTLWRQIQGINTVSVQTINAICKAFPEVSPEWLLSGAGSMIINQETPIRDTDSVDIVNHIEQIINTEGLSASAFGAKCGIRQSTLSHQLNRKRAVSLDTVQAICRTYPDINRAWLLMGEGEMFGGPEQVRVGDNSPGAGKNNQYQNNDPQIVARFLDELAAQRSLTSTAQDLATQASNQVTALIALLAKQ